MEFVPQRCSPLLSSMLRVLSLFAKRHLRPDRRLPAAFRFLINTTIDIDRAGGFFVDRGIRLEDMCFQIIGKLELQYVHDLRFQFFILYREEYFHPFVEVSRHPVRASHVNLRFPVVFKIEDPGVFQKGADDGTDVDRLTHSFEALFETADPAHDQFDLNAGGGGVVEGVDDARVAEGVHLGDDLRRFTAFGVVALPVDEGDEFLAQPVGGEGQFVPHERFRIAREHIEHGGGVLAVRALARKHAHVGVEFGR